MLNHLRALRFPTDRQARSGPKGTLSDAAVSAWIQRLGVLVQGHGYHPERLALLTDAQDPENGGFLLRDLEVLRSHKHSFSDIAVYYRDSGFSNVTLTIGTEPESVQGAFVSSNLFSVLEVAPALGRIFTFDEEARRDRVVILSHGLWARRFGLSPQVIGTDIHIDGESFQVIGIMPPTF